VQVRREALGGPATAGGHGDSGRPLMRNLRLNKYFILAVLLCGIGWRAWAGMWAEVGFGLLGGVVLGVLLGTWKRAVNVLLGRGNAVAEADGPIEGRRRSRDLAREQWPPQPTHGPASKRLSDPSSSRCGRSREALCRLPLSVVLSPRRHESRSLRLFTWFLILFGIAAAAVIAVTWP